jgi:hypothetical protein
VLLLVELLLAVLAVAPVALPAVPAVAAVVEAALLKLTLAMVMDSLNVWNPLASPVCPWVPPTARQILQIGKLPGTGGVGEIGSELAKLVGLRRITVCLRRLRGTLQIRRDLLRQLLIFRRVLLLHLLQGAHQLRKRRQLTAIGALGIAGKTVKTITVPADTIVVDARTLVGSSAAESDLQIIGVERGNCG